MNSLFSYKGNMYPSYIKEGNAASYIIPFAKRFCKGDGLDVGGYLDWVFPGAEVINILLHNKYDALNFPPKKYDFIFSSHTLEHLRNYILALKYWKRHLKNNGVLFLYLPHPDMEYWLPQNNTKHLHSFYPKEIVKLLADLGFKNVISSERDLYWSFSVVGFQ